jgi:hypothetical protein
MTPEANDEFVPILRELSAGIKEGDKGKHLITFKPDPSPYTSSFLHSENWLDFNSMQTWNGVNLIYPFVSVDYNINPPKPVLMAEGAYEEGSEYGFAVTPLWVRRQAYYSYLAGAHHAYGHNDSWRVLPTWKKALDASGAYQMGILKKIFTGLTEWWLLVPDQSIFEKGSLVSGKLLNLSARHKDGKWVMVYLSRTCSFTIKLNKVCTAEKQKIKASWIDPRNGKKISAGQYAARGIKSFSTPRGFEDAVLILEVS